MNRVSLGAVMYSRHQRQKSAWTAQIYARDTSRTSRWTRLSETPRVGKAGQDKTQLANVTARCHRLPPPPFSDEFDPSDCTTAGSTLFATLIQRSLVLREIRQSKLSSITSMIANTLRKPK